MQKYISAIEHSRINLTTLPLYFIKSKLDNIEYNYMI